MKLSVIIPIYNVEKTLQRCVKSILSQGLDNYEVLLIDDGSLDGSGKMADELAATNNNIKVYHKANGGLSDARNYGIVRSTGEYITFVDSDDEIREGSLSALMSIIISHPNYDILEYPVLMNPGRNDEYLFNPSIREYKDCLDWLSEYGLEHCWAWNKIYKRKLFYIVRFPIGKTYEDVYTIGEIIKLKPFIATTNIGQYIYHWNENGISNNQKKNGLTPLLEAHIQLVKSLGINTRERRWHRLYLNILTSQLHSYRKTGNIQLWSQRIVVRKYIRRSDYIKAIMLNIFGLKLSCRIYKLLSRQ